MSLVTEILDRLTGIAVVKERLEHTTDRVEKLGVWLLDHERRLSRMEGNRPSSPPPELPPSVPRLRPGKKKPRT